jgi:predicted RND superfamily exporter protein
MAIFGAPITVVTQILPSFLLAVTIGASIHLLAIFFKEFNLTKDKKASLKYAMGHSGLAIVMTSLTTAAGLWSFSFSELAPVADLGKFASAGVVIGLLFTLILLPAILAMIKLKPKETVSKETEEIESTMDRFLIRIADISVTYPKRIIAIYSHSLRLWAVTDRKAKSTPLANEATVGLMLLYRNTMRDNATPITIPLSKCGANTSVQPNEIIKIIPS